MLENFQGDSWGSISPLLCRASFLMTSARGGAPAPGRVLFFLGKHFIMLYAAFLAMSACVLACVLSHSNCVQLFATLWVVAPTASLPMGFSRQEYWMGCHFLLQGIFPTQGPSPHPVMFPDCRWVLYNYHHLGSPAICKIKSSIRKIMPPCAISS